MKCLGVGGGNGSWVIHFYADFSIKTSSTGEAGNSSEWKGAAIRKASHYRLGFFIAPKLCFKGAKLCFKGAHWETCSLRNRKVSLLVDLTLSYHVHTVKPVKMSTRYSSEVGLSVGAHIRVLHSFRFSFKRLLADILWSKEQTSLWYPHTRIHCTWPYLGLTHPPIPPTSALWGKAFSMQINEKQELQWESKNERGW